MNIVHVLFSSILILSSSQFAHAGVCGSKPTPGVKVSVKQLRPLLEADNRITQGLGKRFCIFEHRLDGEVAMVDSQTLTSRNPSIAASYLLTGVNVDALEKIPGAQSEDVMCRALRGSSIGLHNPGFYLGPKSPKSVCAFGDGSSIGVSELIKSSKDKSFLGLRSTVKSVAALRNMPYQLVESPQVEASNVIFVSGDGIAQSTSWNFIFSGQGSITSGQSWGSVPFVKAFPQSGGVNIQVSASLQLSSGPAQWFQQQARSQSEGTISCAEESTPSELDFAITGNLMIQNETYPIVLGQQSNCWWVAGNSPGWEYSQVNGLVTPDSKYIINGNISGQQGDFLFSVSTFP
jgi:hypothetical protein